MGAQDDGGAGEGGSAGAAVGGWGGVAAARANPFRGARLRSNGAKGSFKAHHRGPATLCMRCKHTLTHARARSSRAMMRHSRLSLPLPSLPLKAFFSSSSPAV